MNPLKRALTTCCGDLSPINLSLLTMPQTFEVHLSSFWLWEAAVFIVMEPFFKPAIGLVQQKYKHLSLRMGMRRSFYLYCFLSYLNSFWVFYSYHRALSEQPYCLKLIDNKILVLGYTFLFIGLALKAYAYRKHGLIAIMGGDYFDLQVAVQPESRYQPYYHPAGTATLALLFGFTLVRASLAGLLLHGLFVLAYHLAFFFERNHVKKIN